MNKLLLIFAAMYSQNLAMACTDFSGTFKDGNTLIRVTQNACISAKIEILGKDGEVDDTIHFVKEDPTRELEVNSEIQIFTDYELLYQKETDEMINRNRFHILEMGSIRKASNGNLVAEMLLFDYSEEKNPEPQKLTTIWEKQN